MSIPTPREVGAVASATVQCSICQTRSVGQRPPVTWVLSQEGGKRTWCCERCARERLGLIEAGLDLA